MKAFAVESFPAPKVDLQPRQPVQGSISKTVVGGVIQSLSVTALAKFNPLEEGCELRWYYKVVKGYREPERSFTDVGDTAHDQLDHYLGTGENVLGKIPLAGLHLLPWPGPRPELKTEWGLNRLPREKKDGKKVNFFPPEQSKLHVAGIPLIGFLDVEDAGDEHVVENVLEDGTRIVERIYEPDTVEILDHKTASDPKWAKLAEKFLETTQMSGYGKFVTNLPEYENVSAVRLSQIYYLTKPPPQGQPRAFKHSIRIPVDVIVKRWDTAVGPLAERMKSAAGERNEKKIPGNLEACGAFGGCPHRNYCYAYKATTPVERLKMSLSKKSTPTPAKESNTVTNPLLNKVRGMTPGGAPANGAPIFAAPGAPPAQAQVLYAKDAVAGAGYKFSTGWVGMFLSAIEQGGQIVYSFIGVDAEGKTGGTPYSMAATERIELVFNPPAPVAPAPPAPPPANPTAGGPPPWNNAAAAAPVAAVASTPLPPAPGGTPLGVPGIRRVTINDTSTPTPPSAPAGAAPPAPEVPRIGKAGKGAKSADPVERAAQVAAAVKAGHELYASLYDVQPTADQAVPFWQALLG